MNKIFAVLIALPLFLSAQNKGDIELGVRSGLILSTFYGDDTEGFDLRSSFQGAGVTGEYYFNDQWGLKLGAIYDTKGSKGVTVGEQFSDAEVRLEYLFIPLYANWHFGKNRSWYLNFGPHLDLLLNAEASGQDVKDFFNNLDFGLGAGMGYRFQISDNASIFLEYQAAGGFLEVFDEDKVANNNIFNTRSSVNIGVVFRPL